MQRHFIVRGRVQGVGYRAWVAKQAAQLAVAGWVRNLGSGEVELVASGSEEQLKELEACLWKGPFLSAVKDVVATHSELRIEPSFQVLQTADKSCRD